MLPRLAALLSSTACLLGACSLLHPQIIRPDVSVISIDMRKGNFLQQEFAVRLHVQNPNDRVLPVRGLQVQLSVDSELIASGVSERAFSVPARSDAEFDMTVTANLALALLKLGNKLNQHADTINFELSGAASVDLPFISKLAFHQSGSLSLGNQSISINN